MQWLQHNIVQIDSLGIPCQFSARGVGCVSHVVGWIMPDGMGVIQEQGVMVEFEPERIITDHPEALQLARKGAAERHLARFVHDYKFGDPGAWKVNGEKWVRCSKASIADVPGELEVHVTFKKGAAELLRFYTEFKSAAHTLEHAKDTHRAGVVGMQFQEGEVLRTSSGRLTSPFPNAGLGAGQQATNSRNHAGQWLMDNAIAEAEARGDAFNALSFKANLRAPQKADRDCAENYLFGKQPEVQSCPLALLSSLALGA